MSLRVGCLLGCLLLTLPLLTLGSEQDADDDKGGGGFKESSDKSSNSDASSDSSEGSSGQVSKPSGNSEFKSYDSSSEGSAPVSFGSSRGWVFGSTSATSAGLSATALDGMDQAKPSSVAYGNFFGMVGGGYAAYKAFELEECIRKKPPPAHCAHLLPGMQSKEEIYAKERNQRAMIAQERAAERQDLLDANMNKDTVQEGQKIKLALEQVGSHFATYAELVGGKHEALRAKDNALAAKVEGVDPHPPESVGGTTSAEEETGDARMGLEESPPAADAQARKSALETKKPPAPAQRKAAASKPPAPSTAALRG